MFKELRYKLIKSKNRLVKRENAWVWSLIAIFALLITSLILLYLNFDLASEVSLDEPQ